MDQSCELYAAMYYVVLCYVVVIIKIIIAVNL